MVSMIYHCKIRASIKALTPTLMTPGLVSICFDNLQLFLELYMILAFCPKVCILYVDVFGSDRSSRNPNVRLSVCPSVCPCVPNLSRAVNLNLSSSESNQREIRRHSKSNQTVSYLRSLKYLALLIPRR